MNGRCAIQLPEGLPVRGVVMADQVKSLDWRARQAAKVCDAPAEIVASVVARVNALMTQVIQ